MGAVADRDVRSRASSVVIEERIDGGRDVERVRREPLEPARVALDPADHRGVEANAGTEQEGPGTRPPDPDAADRTLLERRQERTRRVARATRVVQRLRVHVGGTAG